MKFLILLCSLSFFGSAAFAQTLNVVSTSPANGDFAVDTDSIVITFDQKIDFNIMFGDSIEPDFFFFLIPEDSIEYSGFSLSDDSLSVIYEIELSENTDYTGFLINAIGVDGETLEEPYLFQFTTSSTVGEFIVEGTLPQPMLEKIHEDYPYEDIIVVLSEFPFDFGFDDDDDECFDEECEEDDLRPSYVTFVNPETGAYRISGVREGEYFPVGLNFFGDNLEEEENEFFIPEIYFYDTDENLVPNSITVNQTTAPTDTLSGIDLRLLEIVPISFSDALEIAQQVIENLDNNPVIVGGATFYASLSAFENQEEDSMAFKSNAIKSMVNKIPSIEADESTEEDFFEIISTPSGFQLEWTIFGYDAIKDSAFSVVATPFGAQFSGYLSEEDAEFPEGVSFSDIKILPETFIDSDSAATIIEAHGGWEFREEFSDENSFWNVELQALNNFWDLDEDTTITDAPVMWYAEYSGYSFDPFSDEITQAYFVIYLDIETGEIIYSDTEFGGFNEESLITFSEALELAQPLIDNLENTPEIVGGSTFYASAGIFEDGEQSEFQNKSLSKALASYNEEEGPGKILNFLSEPNGKQFEWELYGYDAVKDSVFSISVSIFDSEFHGYISADEAELPEELEFSDIELLPEAFIDSDSAAVIIEENGGWEFRSHFSGSFDFWEMELTALNNFWELNEDTTVIDAPVMWTGEYYGFSYDPFTDYFVEGYFKIYLDIETGEIIFSKSEISELSNTSHITFNEAVDLADSLMNDLPNNPELLGGSTHYTNVEIIFKRAIKEIPNSLKSKVVAKMEDELPFAVQPDGYAYSWELFAYDPVKDSILVLNVTEFDAHFTGYFGENDFDDPIEFDDIRPLPFTHIDSDSAASIMDTEGALAFRTGMEESEFNWYWDVELELLHDFWDYPLDQSPTAPISWRVEYYAWAYNSETEEVLEDSLTIYLDAETGTVLYSSLLVSNDDDPETPEEFNLSQNYPNPFNPSTNIPFTLSEASRVEISVYSILGQKVATIVNGLYPVGSHNIQWDARNLASGVYIYRMQAGGFSQTRKLILLK
tara:strand:- start:11035 stop:14199 length:3165 start_codon:yes stop_codon:yes gene_type:complete